MRDRIGWASLYAETAEDTAIVVDVVNRRITLAAADAMLRSVLRRFDINTVRWAGCGAKKTGDALFQAILVTLQHVSAAKTLFYSRWPVRIFFRDRRLKHLLECDAHTFSNCCC